jgi:cytoskeletal protein CcmA (bactofilin family)
MDMNNLEQFETTIGPSVKVEGDLVTADNIKIDGIVSGKVHTDALDLPQPLKHLLEQLAQLSLEKFKGM